MRKLTITTIVLATALLISAPAMASTFTMTAITATGGVAYDTTDATAGDKFIVQVDFGWTGEPGINVIAWSLKWDPTEVALTAFSDGRKAYDGKFGASGASGTVNEASNFVTVGSYPSSGSGPVYGELNITHPTYAAGGSSNVDGSSIALLEQFTETVNGPSQIDNFQIFNAGGFAQKSQALGAIAQISFVVLTPANGSSDIDIEVFFRPGADGITGGNGTAGSDLTSANLAIEGGAVIPEPATLFLLGSGLAGLAGFGRRRFKK